MTGDASPATEEERPSSSTQPSTAVEVPVRAPASVEVEVQIAENLQNVQPRTGFRGRLQEQLLVLQVETIGPMLVPIPFNSLYRSIIQCLKLGQHICSQEVQSRCYDWPSSNRRFSRGESQIRILPNVHGEIMEAGMPLGKLFMFSYQLTRVIWCMHKEAFYCCHTLEHSSSWGRTKLAAFPCHLYFDVGVARCSDW